MIGDQSMSSTTAVSGESNREQPWLVVYSFYCLKKMCTKIDVDDKNLFVREAIIKSTTKSKSFPQLVRACGDQS
mgnify:CR=1 FL=1